MVVHIYSPKKIENVSILD